MKKAMFLTSILVCLTGCKLNSCGQFGSEEKCLANITIWDAELEAERQRLDIPESIWQEYLVYYKKQKCGGWEQQWGINWWVLAKRNAEKLLTPYIQQKVFRENLVARFQQAYPENWEQKLLEYDLAMKQEIIRLYRQQMNIQAQRNIANQQYWQNFYQNWYQNYQLQQMNQNLQGINQNIQGMRYGR